MADYGPVDPLSRATPTIQRGSRHWRVRVIADALWRGGLSCYPVNMPAVVNIAGYQFVPLTDLPALRERLLAKSKASGLKGTILLSSEGINVFVAGGRDHIRAL